MKLTIVLLIAVCAGRAAGPNELTEAERRQGWRLLFDGKTTAGWEEITGKPFPTNCWTIEDGIPQGAGAHRWLSGYPHEGDLQFDFDLEFDWKLLKDGNSGVKYLIHRVDEWTNAAGRQARARGLEYQLADDINEDAASDPRRVAGSLYSLIAPTPRIPPRIGEFNRSRIVVKGSHVEHWLNGTKVVEFETTDAGGAEAAGQRTFRKRARSVCRIIPRRRGSGTSGSGRFDGHRLRIPITHALLEEAGIGQQCGTGRAEAEDGVFDGLLAAAHRFVKHAMVLAMRVIALGRREFLRLDLRGVAGTRRVLLAIFAAETVPAPPLGMSRCCSRARAPAGPSPAAASSCWW